MEEKKAKRMFLIGGGVLYLLFLIVYLNISFPVVGHDYRYSIPHLIDTYVHFQNEGFSIQWFSPSFGGGLPKFANPEDVQFSLTQLLVFWVNPWVAVMLSIAAYTVAGYAASYGFMRDVLNIGWRAAILGALFFVTTGFYIQHNSTGPLTGPAFPLIGVFLYVLFREKWTIWRRGVALGLILPIFIFASGFYLLIVLGFTLLLVVPLVYLLKPGRKDFWQVSTGLLGGGVLALLLSAGKLYAIFGFMQNFPRLVSDDIYTTAGQALVGLIFQLVGVPLFTLPLRVLLHDPQAVGMTMTALVGGSQYGIWEMDVSVSPVLMYILFFQVRKLPYKLQRKQVNRGLPDFEKSQWVFLAFFLFACWFVFDFISARGVLYLLVKDLPVLSSLHINIRYTAAFVLPLAMMGAWAYDREFSKMAGRKLSRTFAIFFAGVFLFLGVYFFLPADLQSRNFSLEQSLSDYRSIRAGEEVEVTRVIDALDYLAFSNQATSLYPYEPIFGYDLEEFDTQLTPGSIYLVSDGYYNLTNPRSLVYDTDQLFERFTVEQREMMEQFARYQQPDWGLPKMQLVLNGVSGATALLIVVYWGVLGVRWILQQRKATIEH